MGTIEYFYAAHSSYAYLGAVKLMHIAAAAGRSIVHKPMQLDRVVTSAGSLGFEHKSAGYSNYYFHRELQRWSEERNVPFAGRPTYHHHDMTLANCLLVAGVLRGLNIDRLSHAVLQAHWRFDADLADVERLHGITTDAGYAADELLLDAQSDNVAQMYDQNSREAISCGVLGSPTYMVDGDMFYGQDRLHMVARAMGSAYA